MKTNRELHLRQNITIKAWSKSGHPKALFQPNILGKLTGIEIPFITGTLRKQIKIANEVTNLGIAEIISMMSGIGAAAAFTHLAIGTGTTAVAAADTALETEITDSGLARAAATVSKETTNIANDTLRMTHTWSATGTKSITELGILNAATGGVLLNRIVGGAVNIQNGESYQVQVDIVVA